MWESEVILLVTQILGQDISTLPYWLKLPADIVMQVIEFKTNPEKLSELKEQENDEKLWDLMKGMSNV